VTRKCIECVSAALLWVVVLACGKEGPRQTVARPEPIVPSRHECSDELGSFTRRVATSQQRASSRDADCAVIRPEQPTRELLDKIVSTDGVLERYVHPEPGLLLVDYIEGDYRRVEHLCGKELRARMPDVRRALARDSNHWDTVQTLECKGRALECRYDPGEIGGHEGQYLFKRRPDGALSLYAIVHLESGALDRRKHARFAAAALRTHKHARCAGRP
jgi:hypothetical protein